MSEEDLVRELAARVDRLDAELAELRELGDEADLPVVERTAERMAGTLATLDYHVPRELLEE